MRSNDFPTQLMSLLKARAKALGLTQDDLADQLGVSLPTLKRWLAGKSVTLPTLKNLCDRLGTTIAEIAIVVEDANPAQWVYALEQEEYFADNPDCLAFFDHLIQGYSAKKIQQKFKLASPQVERYLSRLEKLGLIDWLPKNRTKLKITGEPTWRKKGPLALRFKEEILSEFLEDQQKGNFLLNELLPEDIDDVEQKLSDLMKTLRQSHKRAQSFAGQTKSYGTFILLKPYRWRLDDYLRDRS